MSLRHVEAARFVRLELLDGLCRGRGGGGANLFGVAEAMHAIYGG